MRFLTWTVILLAAGVRISTGAEHPADLQALADQAHSVPAEFAAEALLRLTESGKITDRAWKEELLEDAFRQAAGAQQRFKRRAVDPRHDASAAFLNKAFAQDLDAQSLQCRVVKDLLPVDARKARELFGEIPLPQPEPLTCADNLVYDFSAYYAVLAEIANNGFTAKEIADDEPYKLVERYLAGLVSPVQVGPAARMLAALKVKPEQQQALLMSFSGSVQSIDGDPRSFAAATDRSAGLSTQIQALAAAARQNQSSTYGLIEAYRAFLVKHLHGTRCTDSTQTVATFGISSGQPAPLDSVTIFNETLRGEAYPPGTEIKPITGDEVQPDKTEDLPAAKSQCDSADCQQLVSRYRDLIMHDGSTAFTQAEKSTSEWQGKLKEYLSALDEWKGENGADDPAYFRQKCALYSELYNLVPKGPDRDQVVSGLLAFLNRNSYQRDHRAEWFLSVNTLIGRIFADPIGMTQTWKDLRNTEDSVIALFANLEQALPRSPLTFLSLL